MILPHERYDLPPPLPPEKIVSLPAMRRVKRFANCRLPAFPFTRVPRKDIVQSRAKSFSANGPLLDCFVIPGTGQVPPSFGAIRQFRISRGVNAARTLAGFPRPSSSRHGSPAWACANVSINVTPHFLFIYLLNQTVAVNTDFPCN